MNKMVIIFWVVILLVEIVVLSAFISPKTIKENRKEEVTTIYRWFGQEKAKEMVLDTRELFSNTFVKSGIKQESDDYLLPSREHYSNKGMNSLNKAGIWGMIKTRLDSFWLLMESSLLRMKLTFYCFLHCLIFLIPATVDGLVRREICKYGEDNASINVYTYARNVFISTLIFPIIIMLWPMPISPFYIGLWSLVMAISGWIMATNVQHRI